MSPNTEHIDLTHTYGMWMAFIHFSSLNRNLVGPLVGDLH